MAKMARWGAFWRVGAVGGAVWRSDGVPLLVGHSAAARRPGDSDANGKKWAKLGEIWGKNGENGVWGAFWRVWGRNR